MKTTAVAGTPIPVPSNNPQRSIIAMASTV